MHRAPARVHGKDDTASGDVLMKSTTRIVIPDMLRMGCRVEHHGMPTRQTSGYPLSGVGQPSTMHQEYHSMQAGAS